MTNETLILLSTMTQLLVNQSQQKTGMESLLSTGDKIVAGTITLIFSLILVYINHLRKKAIDERKRADVEKEALQIEKEKARLERERMIEEAHKQESKQMFDMIQKLAETVEGVEGKIDVMNSTIALNSAELPKEYLSLPEANRREAANAEKRANIRNRIDTLTDKLITDKSKD